MVVFISGKGAYLLRSLVAVCLVYYVLIGVMGNLVPIVRGQFPSLVSLQICPWPFFFFSFFFITNDRLLN